MTGMHLSNCQQSDLQPTGSGPIEWLSLSIQVWTLAHAVPQLVTVSLYTFASVEVLPDQRWFLDCLLSGTISDVLDRAVTALGGVETAAERLTRTTERNKGRCWTGADEDATRESCSRRDAMAVGSTTE